MRTPDSKGQPQTRMGAKPRPAWQGSVIWISTETQPWERGPLSYPQG